MNSTKGKTPKRLLAALVASVALLAFGEQAQAQEILLTGPLAGAPAVRKLRLHRQTRFEIAPLASFTLLDPYERTILFGARLTFNITDWLGIGAYGAFGAVKVPTALTDHIQEVNVQRRRESADNATNGTGPDYEHSVTGRLTKLNLGQNFKNQIGEIDWIFAPQITLVPFRGKIALFQSVYLDTDLFFFAGPAFVGVKERKNCDGCNSFERESRVAIAPTFGLGLSFYVNKWSAFGLEWRGLPFSRNTGGFDTAGGGKDKNFPNDKIDDADRRFQFNQMLTVSYSFYLPTQYKISE